MCVFGKFYRDIFRGRGEILPFPFKKIVRNARFPWKTICSAVILAKILSFPRLKMRVYSGASDFVPLFFTLSLSLSLTFSFSFSLALTFFTPSPLFLSFVFVSDLSFRYLLFSSSPLCKDRTETREASHKNKKRAKKCAETPAWRATNVPKHIKSAQKNAPEPLP